MLWALAPAMSTSVLFTTRTLLSSVLAIACLTKLCCLRQVLYTLTGHTEAVDAMVCDASGTRLITGSFDSTIRIFDWARGVCCHVLDAHSQHPTLSPEFEELEADSIQVLSLCVVGSRYVVSGDSCGRIRMHDIQTGQLLWKEEESQSESEQDSGPSSSAGLGGSVDCLYAYRPNDPAASQLTLRALGVPVSGDSTEDDGALLIAGDSTGRIRGWRWSAATKPLSSASSASSAAAAASTAVTRGMWTPMEWSLQLSESAGVQERSASGVFCFCAARGFVVAGTLSGHIDAYRRHTGGTDSFRHELVFSPVDSGEALSAPTSSAHSVAPFALDPSLGSVYVVRGSTVDSGGGGRFVVVGAHRERVVLDMQTGRRITFPPLHREAMVFCVLCTHTQVCALHCFHHPQS